MEEKLQREILDRLIIIETKMDNFNETNAKATEAYTTSIQNKEDIKEMQETIKWLWRTTVGAIITGAIGILIAVIKVNIGL